MVEIPAGFEKVGSARAPIPPGFERVGSVNDPSFTDRLVGAAETVGTFASSAFSVPAGGIAGLATQAITGDPDAATAVQRGVQDAFTFEPRTDAGRQSLDAVTEFVQPVTDFVTGTEQFLGDEIYEETGSPLLGALGQAIPTAVSTLVAPPAFVAGRSAIMNRGDATDVVTRGLRRGKAPELGIDEDVLASSQRLNVDLGPEHLSTNPAFIEHAQALKSKPYSELRAVERDAIDALGDRRTELVNDSGGEADRSILNDRVTSRFEQDIAKLQEESNALYQTVEASIPPKTPVQPQSSRAYIERTLDEIGGDEGLLSRAERELLRLSRDGGDMTYSGLDRLRRNVGEGFSGLGIYRTDSEARLRSVYAALAEDQLRIADSFGVGDNYRQATKLVADRKSLEDQSTALLGQQLQKSVTQLTRSAARKLVGGDVSDYQKLMKNMPDGLQQNAAAMVLDELFTIGAKNREGVGGSFATTYRSLQRNSGMLDTLFRHLPTVSRRRFDDMGRVAVAIFEAKKFENASRTSHALLAALDAPSIPQRLAGTAIRFTPLGNDVSQFLNNLISRSRITEAEALLASSEFRAGITRLGEGKVKAADEVVTKSPSFRRWAKQNPSLAAQASQVGFWAWLAGEDDA